MHIKPEVNDYYVPTHGPIIKQRRLFTTPSLRSHQSRYDSKAQNYERVPQPLYPNTASAPKPKPKLKKHSAGSGDIEALINTAIKVIQGTSPEEKSEAAPKK